MGCGASADHPQTGDAPLDSRKPNINKNNNVNGVINQNGHIGSLSEDKENRKPKKKKNAKGGEPDKPVPKPVAFDIGLDSTSNENTPTNKIDSIISKHPPKRLKRLEPLDGATPLTAEMLEEKMRLAEEKRQKIMDKKKQQSRKSSSRLRTNLQKAQDIDKSAQENIATELEEKQRAAELKRQAKQRENEEKKRVREERAKKARERALQLKQENNGLEFDVEKDEYFNAEEEDSWLDGDNNRHKNMGDRVYSGRESPHKPAGRPEQEYRGFSASTTDSFDYAFQRAPSEPPKPPMSNGKLDYDSDDFFDS